MSLMGTLAKVAMGVAVAKGAQTVLARAGGGSSSNAGGGLQDMLGQVLGGGQSSSSQSGGMAGGLGQLLEGLQQQNPNTPSGGLDSLLGGLGGGAGGGLLGQLAGQLGGQSGSTGGSAGGLGSLGGLLGGLGGLAAATSGAAQAPVNDFGSTLNDAMCSGGEPSTAPSAEQDVVAGLLLSAMIQAAKSDGQLDGDERAKLMEHLGDVSADERAFVEAEFAKPVDAKGLANSVPRGLEQQVYLMSILGIDLDNRNEANYLHELASEMGLQQSAVNAIHSQVGAPPLYS
ncbi:MAG: DUF533 domain-containing protein [Devosiaceae bacterium]